MRKLGCENIECLVRNIELRPKKMGDKDDL